MTDKPNPGDPQAVDKVPAAPSTLQANDIHATRVQRVMDYQRQALGNPDPLLATIGSANSGLMSLGLKLEALIGQAWEQVPSSEGQFERVQSSISTYLQLMRQIDRFAQLELKDARRARHAKQDPDDVPRPG